MKQIIDARFLISNVEWFDGDMQAILNKVVEKEAYKEAKWIDNHIKKLLPHWIVKNVYKYHRNRFFRFLVRKIFDIDISIISDLSQNKRIVTIGQRGKEKFSKIF